MSCLQIECPVCGKTFSEREINSHVNLCLEDDDTMTTNKRKLSNNLEPNHQLSQPIKRPKSSDCCEDEKQIKSNGNTDREQTPETAPEKIASQYAQKLFSPNNSLKLTNSYAKIFQPKSKQIEKSSHSNSRSRESPVISSASSSAVHSQKAEHDKKLDNSVESCSQDTLNKSRKVLDNVPLAELMRPVSLDDYIGQEHVVGDGKMLRKLLESVKLPSMILWGPPGCGKTTMARIIAQKCRSGSAMRFAKLSATTSGVSDVKEAIKVAKNDLNMCKRKTVLFIDEIHRFNKLQQDTFLPHVEDGTIILIGATTENPSFQVNNALLSRCKVVVLEKLSVSSLDRILSAALVKLGVTRVHDEQDTNGSDICITDAAVEMLAGFSDGDARGALNALETVYNSKRGQEIRPVVIGLECVKEVMQRTHVQYDRAGDEHYHCASALQKCVRGSDDNGALYWMTRMLEGGEDPLFVARRLVVTASEDIGLADPQALPLAMATFQACQVIGRPECFINLSHCVTYLARAPKSNETMAALQAAQRCIKEHSGPLPGVPLHLRNASTTLMKQLGYGKGYERGNKLKLSSLPDELRGYGKGYEHGNKLKLFSLPDKLRDPSLTSMVTLDHPLNLPVPHSHRKVGLKRKSCVISGVAGGGMGDAVSAQKRLCVRASTKGPADPLVALRCELGWMRQLEMKTHMQMAAWSQGDFVWEGSDVTKKQRADVIESLMVIHLGLQLEQNTLFVAVDLLDRYTQKGPLTRKALRPLALSCLWIASKITDQYHKVPKEWLLMKLLGPSHTASELRLCERMVLRTLGFHLWKPTSLQFAERYMSMLKPEQAAAVREKVHCALELCLRDSRMSYKQPSEVGASALSYALGLQSDVIAAPLKDLSGYDVHQLHGNLVHICNAAYHAYQLQEADPIYNKYPTAFNLTDNVYLRFRTIACKYT